MIAQYLIKLIEEYKNEKSLDINKIYVLLSNLYQAHYGINIQMEMESKGKHNMPEYLEEVGIVDRYVTLLNIIKQNERNFISILK